MDTVLHGFVFLPFPVVPLTRFDHLNSESRGISFPLIREASPEQQQQQQPNVTTSCDDDWSSPEEAVTEAFNRLTSGAGDDGDIHDDNYPHYRALTSEFGSGSEANPALFGPRVVRSSVDVVARRRMAGLNGTGSINVSSGGGGGGGGSQGFSLGGTSSSRDIGGRHGGGDGLTRRESQRDRGSSRAGHQLDRGGTRRWFDDPASYDDDDEIFSKVLDANEGRSASAAQEELPPLQEPLLGFSSGEAMSGIDRARRKPDQNDANAGGLLDEGGASKAGGLRHAEADGFVLGGDVVEGYVSLGPEVRRCVSGDGRGGGLLLSGPPDDDDGKGPGGLSRFREMLYEEGRCKGNLASR